MLKNQIKENRLKNIEIKFQQYDNKESKNKLLSNKIQK